MRQTQVLCFLLPFALPPLHLSLLAELNGGRTSIRHSQCHLSVGCHVHSARRRQWIRFPYIGNAESTTADEVSSLKPTEDGAISRPVVRTVATVSLYPKTRQFRILRGGLEDRFELVSDVTEFDFEGYASLHGGSPESKELCERSVRQVQEGFDYWSAATNEVDQNDPERSVLSALSGIVQHMQDNDEWRPIRFRVLPRKEALSISLANATERLILPSSEGSSADPVASSSTTSTTTTTTEE